MAQHGYLREYDEAWDRGDDRERWRGGNEDFRDSERGRRDFMFGGRDEPGRNPGRGTHDERWSGQSRSSRYGPEHGYGGFQGDFSRSDRQQGEFGGRGDWERAPRNFSSSQDDHYRSWRDRQIQALDRDYQNYCREREQQFHRDFDDWRRNRPAHGSREELIVGAAERLEPMPDPAEPATLGAAEPAVSPPGRARRP